MLQCEFHKQDGSRCRAQAMRRAAYCFSHNPESAERKRAAVTKGGRNRHVPSLAAPPASAVTIQSVGDVETLLFQTLADLRNGRMEESTAKTIGYLGGIAVRVAETAGLAVRLDDLLQRVLDVDQRIREFDATAARP